MRLYVFVDLNRKAAFRMRCKVCLWRLAIRTSQARRVSTVASVLRSGEQCCGSKGAYGAYHAAA
jgi:hypothetical protein